MGKILTKLHYLFIILIFPALSYADSITIPLPNTAISLDPRYIQNTPSLFVSRQINCQLVRNKGAVFHLEAAKSIHYISPNEIKVVINDKVRFRDGSLLTANDVVASYKYIKNSRTVMRNIFDWMEEVKALDDKTIIFYLKKPMPQFLTVLSSPNYAIFKAAFIKKAENDPTLWENPMSCGGYKISTITKEVITLDPLQEGMPITFSLLKKNQLNADEIAAYDIVGLPLIGSSTKITAYKAVDSFDPYQIFIGLNLKNKAWQNTAARCAFLKNLNRDALLTHYNGTANKANDFLPQGSLGYNTSANYFSQISASKESLPSIEKFHLSYLSLSINEQYLPSYVNMIRELYPNITSHPIRDTKQFGIEFSESKHEALLFGLKSNYFDGYEYLQLFSIKDANFMGDMNTDLANRIINSQNIGEPESRALAYQKITREIEKMCVVRPLLTIPMRVTYVKKTLSTPEIGIGPLNEYYLGNITKNDYE